MLGDWLCNWPGDWGSSTRPSAEWGRKSMAVAGGEYEHSRSSVDLSQAANESAECRYSDVKLVPDFRPTIGNAFGIGHRSKPIIS